MKFTPAVFILAISIICTLGACTSSKKSSATGTASTNQGVARGIQLANGQKIVATNVTTSDVDMSMGMSMKNSNTTNFSFQVISADDSSYRIANTITKMKMSMEMMGQAQTYDSDKPEDAGSELGKGLSGKIGKPDTISLDKMKGSTKRVSKLEKDAEMENPMMGMMEAFGANSDSDPTLESAFYMLPEGRKVGDTWSDSNTVKTIKTVKNYKFQALENNIATITIVGTTSGTGDIDMKGTSMNFTMDAKNSGQMLVNVVTNRVNNATQNSDITMNMEVMGQTMPMTAKTTSTTTYQ